MKDYKWDKSKFVVLSSYPSNNILADLYLDRMLKKYAEEETTEKILKVLDILEGTDD